MRLENEQALKAFLDSKAEQYNHPDFIEDDPISIPHSLSDPIARECIGFWVAMLAWGQRKTIIKNGKRLVELMDGAPAEFILHHEEQDRKRFLDFKHRTFQPTDALYFLEFFQQYYRQHDSLETAFSQHLKPDSLHIGPALKGFRETFFALPHAPKRSQKHVATPVRGSTCKRLCMFLRWMVRQDDKGVDFGMWKSIRPSQLLLPLDVHVERVARRLGLIERKQRDWKTVLELTERLRALDAEDPAKYDFALFGIGVMDDKEGLL